MSRMVMNHAYQQVRKKADLSLQKDWLSFWTSLICFPSDIDFRVTSLVQTTDNYTVMQVVVLL